jgi:hypothetical protein
MVAAMTRRSATALGAGIAISLSLLGACGKPVQPAGGQQSSGQSNAVSPTPATAPPPLATQTETSATPQSIADKLAASGIDEAMGFSVNRPMACNAGGSSADWAFHCTVGLADSERSGRQAALEVMIFDHAVDLATKDAKIKDAVAAMNGRWSLDDTPDVTLTNNKTGEKLKLETVCHQSRGSTNGDAYCLLQATSRVLVFTEVSPAQAASDSVTVGEGSNSFEDTRHAADLATLGAIAVEKTQ